MHAHTRTCPQVFYPLAADSETEQDEWISFILRAIAMEMEETDSSPGEGVVGSLCECEGVGVWGCGGEPVKGEGCEVYSTYMYVRSSISSFHFPYNNVPLSLPSPLPTPPPPPPPLPSPPLPSPPLTSPPLHLPSPPLPSPPLPSPLAPLATFYTQETMRDPKKPDIRLDLLEFSPRSEALVSKSMERERRPLFQVYSDLMVGAL